MCKVTLPKYLYDCLTCKNKRQVSVCSCDLQMGEKEENEQDAVKYYRLSEIEAQNTFKSTWIIINNNVYDVTKFLEEVRSQTQEQIMFAALIA